MSNVAVQGFGGAKGVLLIALSGIFLFWLTVIAANIVGIYQDVNDPTGQAISAEPYIWLAGIAFMGAGALIARRETRKMQPQRLTHAVGVFSQVLVIATLLVGTIYGFTVFAANALDRALSGTGVVVNELSRIMNVYLPIVLDAALLIAVIILAYVHQTSTDEEEQTNA